MFIKKQTTFAVVMAFIFTFRLAIGGAKERSFPEVEAVFILWIKLAIRYNLNFVELELDKEYLIEIVSSLYS
ncbi:hypothetical protein Tco_0242476 [Tanacetum coccineum]